MRRAIGLLVVGLCGCVGEGSPPAVASQEVPTASLGQFLSDAGYVRLEMARLRTGHFSVTGMAGGVPLAMIIDTGASHTLIDSGRAERFDLDTRDRGRLATGLGTTTQRTETGHLQDVVLGAMRFDTLRVTVLDLSNVNQVLTTLGNEPIDGVIGADILMSRAAVIDYGSLNLYFRQD